MSLPPRLYSAQVLRVSSYGIIDVQLALDFNVGFRSKVQIEGVSSADVPAKLRNAAMRALILLVGGAEVFLYMLPDQVRLPHARVYRQKSSVSPREVGNVEVPGLSDRRIDVGLCLRYLRDHEYSRESVHAAIGSN
jgi:hypothetical protein